jgi:hypothetical protein
MDISSWSAVTGSGCVCPVLNHMRFANIILDHDDQIAQYAVFDARSKVMLT